MAAIIEVTERRVFPVSLLTFGVSLFQTGVAPTWVAALLGIAAILWPIGHIGGIQLVEHLAELLLLVPLVWLGLRFLRGVTPQVVAVPANASSSTGSAARP